MATITAPNYLGWANRETWLASLWLNSAEDAYYLLKEALQESGDSFHKASWLEEALRDQLESESIEPSLWSDLLSTAFERINWVEVIDNNQ